MAYDGVDIVARHKQRKQVMHPLKLLEESQQYEYQFLGNSYRGKLGFCALVWERGSVGQW